MTRIVLCLSLLCLSLGACSPFKSNQPPPNIYALHAQEPGAEAARARKPVLAVQEPAVPAGFEGNRIAVHLENGRRLDYAAASNWPGALPKTLQDFLIQSGRATPLMVVAPDFGIPADYTLLVRVNDFSPWYAGTAEQAPVIRISLSFTLLGAQSERVFSNFTLARSASASANRMTVITAEMEAMLQEMVAEAYGKLVAGLPSARSNTKAGD